MSTTAPDDRFCRTRTILNRGPSVVGIMIACIVALVITSGLPARASLPYDQLMSSAKRDINRFWSTTLGRGYRPPSAVQPYSGTISTRCGKMTPANAHYCSTDNTIYYDSSFLKSQIELYGEYAAVHVLAHEWGHLIQAQIPLFSTGLNGRQIELQADCLAGAFAFEAAKLGMLEEGDLAAA